MNAALNFLNSFPPPIRFMREHGVESLFPRDWGPFSNGTAVKIGELGTLFVPDFCAVGAVAGTLILAIALFRNRWERASDRA